MRSTGRRGALDFGGGGSIFVSFFFSCLISRQHVPLYTESRVFLRVCVCICL